MPHPRRPFLDRYIRLATRVTHALAITAGLMATTRAVADPILEPVISALLTR